MKNKFPPLLMALLCSLALQSGIISLILYRYSIVCGVIGLVSAIVLIAALAIVLVIYSKNATRHFSKMTSHLETSAARYINSLPAPVAVLDSDRKFVWYNQIFSEKISLGTDVYGMDAESVVKIDMYQLENEGFSYCRINGSFYRVAAEKFDENDISFLILYLHDETAYFNIKKRSDEEHPNVVILKIDNYDDIVQNAKESEKALASVETEQLIEQFMSSTNGFVKRISPSTFYAVLENKHVEEKINNKFKILDLARNIKIANKYQLTFSIGVGLGASSLAESEHIARQCLDMALGRGGDQAVVKTDGGYRFFGGVSKGVEKMSRSKTRSIADGMQDIINRSGKVFIMGHRFGDLDSVGASCGLAGAVRLLGKTSYIAVDRTKNLASKLIDMVNEKSEDDIFITPAAAVASIAENDLLIITDTHNKDFLESRELYDKARNVIVIDHHRKTINFIDNATIFHHEPYASSASEMVTELIQYFHFEPDKQLQSYHAEALLAGIMLDTKNFVMRTGARTFEAAAYLKKAGADTVAVKQLFSSSFEAYKRRTQIVASASIHCSCAIAVADFKCDDIRIVAPQAADELLNISDVDASFVVYSTGSVVNISGRSLGAVNVQVIMEELGGGGHQTMAATQIENVSVEEAVRMLKRAIDKRLSEIQSQKAE